MAGRKSNREYFAVDAYVKWKPQKIGYAYKTTKGNIAIRADKIMDETPLGRHFKNGLCIKLKNKQEAAEYQGAMVGTYVDGQRQNIGRVLKIEKGKIFIQGFDAMNSKKLGGFLKKGLYVHKQKIKEYQSYAEEIDNKPLAFSAVLSHSFKTSISYRRCSVKFHP